MKPGLGVAGLCLSLLLSACGGGSSGDAGPPASTSPVPAAAGGSAGQLQYNSGGSVAGLALSSAYVAAYPSVKGDGKSDDTAALQAIVDSVSAGGGGNVYLEGKTYYIPGGLLQRTGVHLVGVGCGLNSALAYGSGTRLLGNNTHPAVSYAPATYSAQPTSGQVEAEWLYAAGVENLCTDTTTYGLQFGGLFNSGLYNGLIRNVIVLNPSQWGFYCENCTENIFDTLYVYQPAGQPFVGGMYWGSSNTGYNHGNSTWRHLYVDMAYQARGVVFQARAGSVFNDLNISDAQASQLGFYGGRSQAATMSSGSPNITVTDGTQYPVDMPVTVSATANGFTKWRTYFVVSQSGNTIQLSNRQRDAALAAGGSAPVNVVTYGWPALELSGLSHQNDPNNTSGTDSRIQAAYLDGIDMEGTATTDIVVQNAGINLNLNYVQGGNQGAAKATDVTIRGSSGTWSSNVGGMAVDLDFASSFSLVAAGSPRNDYSSDVQPTGLYVDSNGLPALNLSPSGATPNLSTFREVEPQGGGSSPFTYPQVAIGQAQNLIQYACNFTLPTNYAGTLIVASNSSTTCTLPLLDNSAPASTVGSFAGSPYQVVNGGSGTLILAANAGQNFMRNPSLTQYAIQPFGSISLHACWDGTADFWCVDAANGATPNAPLIGNGSPGYTIATLPGCTMTLQGQTAYVTNGQAAPAYLGTVSATGSTVAPVFCNGTSWVYH